MVTEETDVSELINLVVSIGQDIEESTKILETMSEVVRKGTYNHLHFILQQFLTPNRFSIDYIKSLLLIVNKSLTRFFYWYQDTLDVRNFLDHSYIFLYVLEIFLLRFPNYSIGYTN